MKTQGSSFGSRHPRAVEPAGIDLIFGKHPTFDFALDALGHFRALPPEEGAGKAALGDGHWGLLEWVHREVSRFIDVQQSATAPFFKHLVEEEG